MKIIVALISLSFCINAFAVGRPSGRKGKQSRAGEITARAQDVAKELATKAGDILGQDVIIELPQRLTQQESKVYEQRIDALTKTLEARKADILRDSAKKGDIYSLLDSLSPALKARDSYKDFVNSKEADAASKEVAKDVIKLIDNLFVIMQAKLNESFETPVSTNQIQRVLNELGGTKVADMTGKDVQNVEKVITRIFGKEFTMKQAANCK